MAGKRRAALGFKVHTGWAAVVAVGGPSPQVLAKLRLQVAWTFDEGAVFHVARELPLPEARALVTRRARGFEEKAEAELATFVAALDAEVVASAVVWGNEKPLPPFESILRSHPLVHAAEADLYRHVFAEAAGRVLGAPPRRLPSRDLPALAFLALHLGEAELAERMSAMGKASGRPWTVDQREAALAAWLALVSRGKRAD